MLERAKFRNLKALRDVTVPLRRLNLIVGPNSSGKTTVLHGLHWFSQLGKRPASQIFSGPRHPLEISSRGSAEAIELTGTLPGKGISREISFSIAHIEKFSQLAQCVVRFSGTSQPHGPVDQQSLILPGGGSGNTTLKEIASAVFLKFEINRLAAANAAAEPAWVRHDGFGLAATLANLKLGRDEVFQAIEDSLREVVPSVRKLRIISGIVPVAAQDLGDDNPTDGTRVPGYQVAVEFIDGALVPSHSLSEGTLLSIGLLTVLHLDNLPRMVLIDELERGLHPRALRAVVENLKRVTMRNQELQVVATTHSPYLVDEFSPDDVLLTSISEAGSTSVKRLVEHPDFRKWKDEFRAGEFWSMVGEKWVTEGADKRAE